MRDRRRLGEVRRRLREALRDPGAERGRIDSRLPRRQLKHFDTPTTVNMVGVDARGRSIVEVVARARPGLLAHIGWALADCEVRLQNAKVATFGERAEDVFFLTDPDNRPIEPERFEAVRDAVAEALSPP